MEEWIYDERNRLGEPGGFGDVYRCDKRIGDITEPGYVIKKLRDLSSDSIRRFQKEVRTLNNLSHPRVVKVEGYNLKDEPYFYTMRQYAGSLCAFLPGVTGNFVRIKTVFNSIFDGVDYLHKEGIYHRDLKPANVLMNSDQDLAISDLGLQRDLNSESTRLTQTGYGMGSILYMAPEQLTNAKTADHRSDIYSLGRMIYECFTGRLTGLYADLHRLPGGIRYVVDRATKNDPEERFQSVSEMRIAFTSAIDLLIHGSQQNNLQGLVNTVKSSPVTGEVLNRLISALVNTQLENEGDFIHEMVMEVPSQVIYQIWEADPILAGQIIDIFIRHITSQGWSFGYTDKIGDKCEGLYNIFTDIEIRAKLIYTIAEVGLSHNRWRVMNIAKSLLHSVDDEVQAFAIAQALRPLRAELGRLDLQNSRLLKPISDMLALDN